MKILIITGTSDFHTDIVESLLLERGNHVFRLNIDTLLWRSTVSFNFSSLGSSLLFKDGNVCAAISDFDVVWRRRLPRPLVPDYVADEDVEFVRLQARAVIESIENFPNSATWINDPLGALRAELKPLQLALAHDIGFHTPGTLVGNDPTAIRSFMVPNEEYVYKSLKSYLWLESAGANNFSVYNTYTSLISQKDIDNYQLIRACMGIYETRVSKSYEVRCLFIGYTCFAIKIPSGTGAWNEVDWRINQNEVARCESIAVPEKVRQRCIKLMRELGIITGCFDFIVDTAERWVFLEVNQGGEFLFLEQWCPSLPILDAFVSFVENPSSGFVYKRSCRPTSISSRYELLRCN